MIYLNSTLNISVIFPYYFTGNIFITEISPYMTSFPYLKLPFTKLIILFFSTELPPFEITLFFFLVYVFQQNVNVLEEKKTFLFLL